MNPASDLLAAPLVAPAPRSRKRSIVIAVLLVVVVLAVIRFGRRVVGPSLGSLTHPHWGWLPVALLAEAISMGAFARMQRHTLAQGGVDVPLPDAASIVYASNALSVTVPVAGGTASLAFLAQQYARRGASAPLVTWTLAVTGLASAAALAVLVGVGGIFSSSTPVAIATGVSAGIGLFPILALFVLLRSERSRPVLVRGLRIVLALARRFVRRPTGDPERIATEMVHRLAAFRLERRPGAVIVGFALLNWIADIVVLAAAVAFVGAEVPWESLVLVYAAAIGAATIGFTPAGIGIVEVAIGAALVATGLPSETALPAAIVYRAISCWLVLTIGWLLLTMLRRRGRSGDGAVGTVATTSGRFDA